MRFDRRDRTDFSIVAGGTHASRMVTVHVVFSTDAVGIGS